MSDTGLERANSHDSEHPRYSGHRFGQLNGMNGGPNAIYPSPTVMRNPLPAENGFDNSMAQQENNRRGHSVAGKAFQCSTCGKGFGKRGVLNRHERIHSGIRPHICEYPGCGKKFIQGDALTVHRRKHTGEKPHMCERCGKPFSDKSALNRHRRVHSGTKPHSCPYANCQKTFSRRTNLKSHQNRHTGTVEEVAVATAAALANHSRINRGRQQRSDREQYSNNGSPISIPSPNNLSASPNSELGHMNGISCHPGEYEYMNQLGSAGGNLHMSTVGWQFPSQNMLASSQSNGYVYPHPNVYGSGSDINQYVQNEDGYRAFTGPFANSLLFWHTDKSACGGP